MKTSARTKLLSACIISLLTVPPSVAFAGPEEAAEYYEQASQAYQSGDYDKAAKLLRRAFAEDSNLIYKYNRILALQAMGDIDTALEELDVWENRMKEDGRFDDIDEIRQQLEEAKAKAETEKKDDTETAEAGSGDKKDGDATHEDKDGKDGDGKVVKTDPVEPVEPAEQGPNILGWSLVGVGVAGLGTAGLFGSTVLISDIADRREQLASGTSRAEVYQDFDDADAQFQDDQNTWSTHQTITWVSLGLGAVALIGGGAVLLMDAGDDTEAEVPVSADNAEVSFSPYVGADGAGGVLHISF